MRNLFALFVNFFAWVRRLPISPPPEVAAEIDEASPWMGTY